MNEDTNAPKLPIPLSEEVIKLKHAMRKKNRFLDLAYKAEDTTTKMRVLAVQIDNTIQPDTNVTIFRNGTALDVPFFEEWWDKNSSLLRGYGLNTKNTNLFMSSLTITIGTTNETLIAVGLRSYLWINEKLEAQFNLLDYANDEELHSKRQAYCLNFWVNAGVDCIIINPSSENYNQLSSALSNFYLPAVLDFANNASDPQWEFDKSNFFFPAFFFGECNRLFSAGGAIFHDITYFFTNFKSTAIFTNANFLEYTCFWQNTFAHAIFEHARVARRIDFVKTQFRNSWFDSCEFGLEGAKDAFTCTPPVFYSIEIQTKDDITYVEGEPSIKILMLGADDGANFIGGVFSDYVLFSEAKFLIHGNFQGVSFRPYITEFGLLFDFIPSNTMTFDHCVFDRECVFGTRNADSRRNMTALNLRQTKFRKKVYFGRITFQGRCDFTRVETHEEAKFEGVEFNQELQMDGCTWKKGLGLIDSVFKEDVDLSYSTSKRALNINKCDFHKGLLLERVQLDGGLKIAGDLDQKTTFSGPVILESAKMNSLSLLHTKMAECPNLLGAELKSPIIISDTTIGLPPKTEEKARLDQIATYFRRMKQLADEAKDFKHALEYFSAEQHCLARAGITTRVERALFVLYLNLCNAGRDFVLPLCWLIFLIITSGTVVASGSLLPLALFGVVTIVLFLLMPFNPRDSKLLLFFLSILGCILFVIYYGDSTFASLVSVLSDLLNAIAYTALNAVSFTQVLLLLDGTIDGLQCNFPAPFNNQPGEYAGLAILFSKAISLTGLILSFLIGLCVRNFLRLK